MSEWKRVSLGDICSFKYGKMPKKTDKSDTGFPIFSGYGIVGFAKTYLYEKPEVIVVARGVGGTGDVKMSPPKCFLTNLSIAAQITCPEVDKQFLYYRLQHPSLWELRTGSAQAQITIAHLEPFETDIPSLSTQKKIASILSAYDDLIENNTRRIAILEAMAQAIYREWFVNFRFPGHENVKLVDSPLGQIPEGWEVVALQDAVDEIIDCRGKTPKKLGGDWSETGVMALSAMNVKTGRLIKLDQAKYVDEALYAKWMKSEINEGDILLTSEAPLGEAYYVPDSSRYCLSQRLFSIRTNLDIVKSRMLYQYLISHNGQALLRERATGTTVLGIRQSRLREIPVLIPAQRLQTECEGHLTDLMSQANTLAKTNHNLRTTRDLLLPKLISGKLDVEDLDIDMGMTAEVLQEMA